MAGEENQHDGSDDAKDATHNTSEGVQNALIRNVGTLLTQVIVTMQQGQTQQHAQLIHALQVTQTQANHHRDIFARRVKDFKKRGDRGQTSAAPRERSPNRFRPYNNVRRIQGVRQRTLSGSQPPRKWHQGRGQQLGTQLAVTPAVATPPVGQPVPPFRGLCWSCNKTGHRAADCPLKFQNTQDNTKDGYGGQKER